jgi:aminoglycoside phosphotransferase
MNLVEQFLETGRGNAAVDGFRPFGSVVLTPRFPDSRHVVVLLLDVRGRVSVVGKIVRSPGDPSTLDQEAEVLEALADLGSSGRSTLAGSVPRLLALEWVKGHRLLLQTAVEGKPVTHGDARRRVPRWWSRVETWLDGLQTPIRAPVTGAWLDSYLGARINLASLALTNQSALTRPVGRAMAVTATLAAELRRASPFAVVEHGDLSHPNVLSSAAGLSVVDWETGHTNGLVGVDAAVFLTFLELARARAHGVEREAQVYAATMLEEAGPARQRLIRHLGERGVPADLVDHVLVAAWGRIALAVFPRLLAGPRADTAAAQARAVRLFTEGRPFRLWMMTLERSPRFTGAG